MKSQLKDIKHITIPERITSVWAWFMVAVFPLFFTNFYFNILESKYYFYCTITSLAIVSLVLWYICSGKVKEHISSIPALNKDTFREFIHRIRITDICVLFFVLFAIVSTLFSDYPYEALTGSEGRHNGLILILFYGASYFFCSKYFRYTESFENGFLWVGLALCFFGILNFFKFDLFGFYERVDSQQSRIFTSTIGNLNTYCSYCGMLMAYVSSLLIISKREFKDRLVYYIIALAAFIAILAGRSDNAFLSLGALVVFLFFVLCRNYVELRRYFEVLSLLIIAAMAVIYCSWEYETWYIDGILFTISQSFYILPILLVVCCVLIGLCVYYKNKIDYVLPVLKRIGFYTLLALFCGVVVALIVVNLKGNIANDYQFANFFVFNDQWGTHRGFTWRICLEEFQSLPLYQQLFGAGPDTFGIYMINHHYSEMLAIEYTIIRDAHNEYLHYLFTHGILGLAAYLGILVSTMMIVLKNRNENAIVLCFGSAVFCYSVQSFVNIAQPITTPLLWLFIAIAQRPQNVKLKNTIL